MTCRRGFGPVGGVDLGVDLGGDQDAGAWLFLRHPSPSPPPPAPPPLSGALALAGETAWGLIPAGAP